jgi:flagellar biosynthesis/type III secretory pathway protein FliH
MINIDNKIIDNIIRQTGIKNVKVQQSDQLDFHDIHINQIRDMLAKAYNEGHADGYHEGYTDGY